MSATYTQEITVNLGEVSDYGITTHVPKEDAERAIQVAENLPPVQMNFLRENSRQNIYASDYHLLKCASR